MQPFAINHMTAPRVSFASLVSLAGALGCGGVEVRNDLDAPLFDGLDPQAAAAFAADHGVAILAVAEVPAFNDLSERAYDALCQLAAVAEGCGAIGVALIPEVSKGDAVRDVEHDRLCQTLERFAPVLAQHGLLGFIEPLGFEQASIRHKSDVLDALAAVGVEPQFKLVHDTFHHHLAGEQQYFPAQTGVVHISGVTNVSLATAQMADADRVLVDQNDLLDNVGQLNALRRGGYTGAVSIEAFAPSVHQLSNPKAALSACFHCIDSAMVASAA